MNKTTFCMKIVIIFLLLTTFCTYANDSYENLVIEKVNVVWETTDSENLIDPNAVLSKLKTRENELFSQLVFDSDLKKLSEEYEKVSPQIKVTDGQLEIDLHIWVKPTVARIDFSGNKVMKTRKLKKELDIKIGSHFTKDQFAKALNKVKDLYTKKGYFESDINYEIEKIPNTNDITIKINIHEGKCGKVKRIIFKGFTKSEERDLKQEIYSKRYNVFLSWLTGHGIFRQDVLDQDQMTILSYLNNKGYADAKVDIDIKEAVQNRGIILRITAHRGTLYHIGNVSFANNKLFSNEEIDKKLLIKKGDIFSPEKVRETAQSIKDHYGNKGYIETQVIQETYLSENDSIYDVHFDIEEGDQFKIGLIRVFGNHATNSNVILRESLLIPGNIFDSRKLKYTQQRLQNIGYFKNVNVYAVKAQENALDDNYRDVYIEVDETTTGSANLSLGLSTLDDIYGSFELTERNFNIKGIPFIFSEGPGAMRGAGEYANAKVVIGRKQRTYNFTWLDPYFRDSLWRFGFDISGTMSKLQSKDYKIKTCGGSVFAAYPISNYWTYENKYRLKHSKTELKHPGKTKVDEEIEDNHGLISALSATIKYDSTDNPYKAHKGLRSALELEYCGVFGNFYFLKLQFLNSMYTPLWPKGTLKTKADFRFIEPVLSTNKDELPMSERFFLGGETTVRGYKPYILGPRRPGKEDDPLGGISSTLLSVECSHALFSLMDVFVFFDSGCISNEHFKIPKLNASYGLGTRLEIMNRVPITIGYGVPINPDRKDDKHEFFFSMGGQF